MYRPVLLSVMLSGIGCLENPTVPEVFITPVEPFSTDDLLVGGRFRDPSGLANAGGAFLILAP